MECLKITPFFKEVSNVGTIEVELYGSPPHVGSGYEETGEMVTGLFTVGAIGAIG